MTRLFMLGYIFSRMLNPLSYSVFILFILSVYVTVVDIFPTASWEIAINIITPLYTTLLFIRLLICLIALYLFVSFICKVMIIGKFVVKLSTFSFIAAICVLHAAVYFSVNGFPLALTYNQKNHALYSLYIQTPIELIATLLLGIMLALYVGVLSKERFKKNIGFIDDAIVD